MSNHIGKLIVIEGIDGSGKATQTRILFEKLKASHLDVETIDFPQYTNNFFGRQVRRYLNGEFGDPTKVNPYLASILYAADRWESSDKIKQWLDQGKIVLLDRYYTSNLIHQGTKFSQDELEKFISWNEAMEFDTFQIPRPDLILYLHLPAAMAYDLITKRGQGHDGHDTLEHMQTAETRCQYLAAKLNWQTIECCDTTGLLPIEEIANIIWHALQPILEKNKIL
ncbi:MAG: dTMP kinase [Candidatus Buchananbacteria bacterium]|nr:dTMP kinase [Candidatus Buchananbacteria bacterium]